MSRYPLSDVAFQLHALLAANQEEAIPSKQIAMDIGFLRSIRDELESQRLDMVGVMQSVDKWKQGMGQPPVDRASEAREYCLRQLEGKDREITRLQRVIEVKAMANAELSAKLRE